MIVKMLVNILRGGNVRRDQFAGGRREEFSREWRGRSEERSWRGRHVVLSLSPMFYVVVSTLLSLSPMLCRHAVVSTLARRCYHFSRHRYGSFIAIAVKRIVTIIKSRS